MSDANRQIWEEASAWFVEFRLSSVTNSSRDEFLQWLCRSPDHIRAYLEVSQTYVQLPAPGVLPTDDVDRLIEKARARLTNDVIPIDPRIPRPLPPVPNRIVTRHRSWAIAASIVVVLAGGFIAWRYHERGVYATEAGEGRTVTLADGSRIELNGRTRLRVSYSDHERDIALLEGQALFQVAKDKSRPFIVDTGTAQVRAVGTAFDVHKEGAETTVTVLEGTVAVLSTTRASPEGSTTTAGAAPDLFVTAGEQAVVSPTGSRKPHAANVAAVTAWTRGQLEFDETPLAQVAEQFNRSSPRPLVLDSESAGKVRISGIYSSVDPASLILFLRNQPDLAVTESPEGIEVRARTQ
jgi:transmembrane sensor